MTPGAAVRLASVARHVTDCATRPLNFYKLHVASFKMDKKQDRLCIFTTAFTFEQVNLIFEASQLELCYSIMSVRVR